jgi:hypothetical protein
MKNVVSENWVVILAEGGMEGCDKGRVIDKRTEEKLLAG